MPTEPAASSPVLAPGSWRDHVESLRPTVLLLGGFLTAPPMYRRFVERLRSRGAASVLVSAVWTPDWMLAASRGLAAITTRAGRALLAATRVAVDESEGAPLLVIGHSAGGVIARILTAPEPFEGRRFGAAARIGAIVTLGTPHRLSTAEGLGRKLHGAGLVVVDASVPGAWFAPDVGYVSVGSNGVAGDPQGSGQERVSYRMYRSLLASSAPPGTRGDGLVPESAAMLSGSREVAVNAAVHGPGAGGPWYGADGPLDEWWPVAVDAWREALRCRASDPAASLARLADAAARSRERRARLAADSAAVEAMTDAGTNVGTHAAAGSRGGADRLAVEPGVTSYAPDDEELAEESQ